MHRFYLPPHQCRDDELRLTGSEAHHALHVVRLRRGERILVIDGAGRRLVCEVVEPGRKQVQLRILEQSVAPPLPCQVTLLQALPKGKLIEPIIQKATELGVARVIPLLADRTVIQLAPEERKLKSAKWQSIAMEAIKQCGSAWLPAVEAPLTVHEFLQRNEKSELALVGSLSEPRAHPRTYFESFRQANGRNPTSAGVWIGPEGDFTPQELDAIKAAGAQPISLGPLVLRAETAAVYSLSVLN